METDGYARSRRRVTSTSAFSFVWRYYFRVCPPRSARSTSPSYNGVLSLSRRYLTRWRGCSPTRRLFNFTAAQLLLPGNYILCKDLHRGQGMPRPKPRDNGRSRYYVATFGYNGYIYRSERMERKCKIKTATIVYTLQDNVYACRSFPLTDHVVRCLLYYCILYNIVLRIETFVEWKIFLQTIIISQNARDI